MIQIQDVIVSLDIFREKFLCDLDACKGECCVEGDAGAPVELDEVADFRTRTPGGHGAVCEVMRRLMMEQGTLDAQLERYRR